MSTFASAAAIAQDVSALYRAPRRMPVSGAISAYMRVPVGAGSSVPWDMTLTPYMREPVDLLASRQFDAVVFVGPARTGKTLALIDGWIVYGICCDPGDMLVVQMTETKAREHSRTRLSRTFYHSPEVARRLSPLRNDNNVHDKIFRDGSVLKIGWPSVKMLSSSDYRRVALTDYDRFPEDIDGEGDAFSLASKRTTTFMSAGMTLVESSPGREITDPKWKRSSEHAAPPATGIISLYNRGDRRRWYWQCPSCGEYFQPVMANVTGYRGITDAVAASEQARVQCPHCKALIAPDKKRELNNGGVWLTEGQRIDRHGVLSGEARRSRVASFWMEGPAAAYQTLAQLVYKLLSAEEEYNRTGSQETLKAVITTDWGVPYAVRGMQDRDAGALMERAEDTLKRTVPPGVRFLLAAVDVQGGNRRRFVVQITGYGEAGERWIIDRYNIRQSLRCDENGEAMPVNPAAHPEDWQLLLSDVLEKSYPLTRDADLLMPVMCMAVDSGGEDGVTDNAYRFWRKCRREGYGTRVYLFKGDASTKAHLIRKTYPDNTERSDRKALARGDVPVWLLNTNELKDRIAAALDRSDPGPNYIHFPHWLGEWFYDELTNESRDSNGKWQRRGKGANEALDLMCYAHALAVLRGYERVRWDNPPAWVIPLAEKAPRVARDEMPPAAVSSPVVVTAPVTPPRKPGSRTASTQGGWGRTGGGWL